MALIRAPQSHTVTGTSARRKVHAHHFALPAVRIRARRAESKHIARASTTIIPRTTVATRGNERGSEHLAYKHHTPVCTNRVSQKTANTARQRYSAKRSHDGHTQGNALGDSARSGHTQGQAGNLPHHVLIRRARHPLHEPAHECTLCLQQRLHALCATRLLPAATDGAHGRGHTAVPLFIHLRGSPPRRWAFLGLKRQAARGIVVARAALEEVDNVAQLRVELRVELDEVAVKIETDLAKGEGEGERRG